MSRLSDKTVFKGDENCSKESGGCSTFETTHCKICERDGSNTQDGRQHSHCDIWYIFIDPVVSGLPSILLLIVESSLELTWRSP